MNTLPNKASALITVALDDLQKAEASPDYVIEMGVWHTPGGLMRGADSRCAVCMAGAVMAGTLGASIHKDMGPAHYRCDTERTDRHHIAEMLNALDDLRLGELELFINLVHQGKPCDGAHGVTYQWIKDEGEVPCYEDNKQRFHEYLRGYSAALRTAGF